MIKEQIEEFKKYVSSFDMNVEAIDMKYNHTLRVVACANRITANVEDSNIKRLSLIGALLHDISRFKQWTEYKTFDDNKSFDHGDEGGKILFDEGEILNYNIVFISFHRFIVKIPSGILLYDFVISGNRNTCSSSSSSMVSVYFFVTYPDFLSSNDIVPEGLSKVRLPPDISPLYTPSTYTEAPSVE